MEFTCVLVLTLLLLSVKANLQVQIVKEDVNIYRNINQSLSLNCTATTDDGRPPNSILWKKDSKDINSTLSSNNWAVKMITRISRPDAGYYKCVAKYNQSQEEAYVFVNVEGKPMIFKSGEPQLISRSPTFTYAGEPYLDLKCHATGSKLISYRWFKNGKEIKPGMEGFMLITEENGKTLKLEPVVKDKLQPGMLFTRYTCEARNRYGMDTNVIYVKVLDQPLHPIVRAEKSMISSYVGQANKFVCYGKNIRKVDADTAWFFNGKKIAKEQIENCSRLLCGETVFGDEESKTNLRMSLILKQTSLQDAGNYTCVVVVNQESYNQTTLLVVKRKAEGPSGGTKDRTEEIVGVVVGLVLLAIAILILILYLTKKRNKMNYPEIPKGHFKYGAFVTYNSQDFNWVETNLLPLLEKNGIEVCIHYRNFEPGVAILENMVNSIYMSRVVIVVMSNNYMKSKYCRAELDYAVHRSLEEHGTLMILRIDPEITKNKLPKEIKNKTFLDFTSNVEKATWEKRLLKYIKCDDDKNEDENENVREDEEQDECVAFIQQGHEENAQKDDVVLR